MGNLDQTTVIITNKSTLKNSKLINVEYYMTIIINFLNKSK